VNFALYESGRRVAWVLSEYPRASWLDGDLAIGGSSLRIDRGGRVRVEIDERTAPWGRPVQARIELEPLAAGLRELELVPGAPHYWQARAPFAHACVEVSSHDARFDGRGYFDGNRGSELLGGGLPGWRWARLHLAESTEILYEPPLSTIHICASGTGTSMRRNPERPVALTRTRWGLPVPRSFTPAAWPELSEPRLLESSPFYARLQASAPGAELLGEVADFRRFHQPSVRWMARFRTRVEA
jgi:carotenoid 1,2-hydratase